MTHVRITSAERDSLSITVDGQDVSMKVLRKGFAVSVPPDFGPPEVTLVVEAEVLEIDLPDAVVKALRDSEHPGVRKLSATDEAGA